MVHGVEVTPRRWQQIRLAYADGIAAGGREPAFLLTLAFLLTFAAVRLITHGIKDGWLPLHNLGGGGLHIHHMVPGMLLVLVAGYLSLVLGSHRPTRLLAVLFGIGAALVLDEFALWLRLADVYWEPEGRESIDAVVIAGGIALLGVLGRGFWPHLGASAAGRSASSHDTGLDSSGQGGQRLTRVPVIPGDAPRAQED